VAIAAAPLVAAAMVALRRLDLRQAAAAVDRALGLDERVATALECAGATGAMPQAVILDAAAALGRAEPSRVGRFRWPSEARFVIPAAALTGALWWAPAAFPGAPGIDPAVRMAISAERAALERAVEAHRDPARAAEARRLLEALSSEDLARVRHAAREAREMAAKWRAEEALARGSAADRAERRLLAEALESAGAGASRELSRRSIEVPPVDPVDLEARVLAARAGQAPAGRAAGPASDVPGGEAVRRALERRDWDSADDQVVRRYYERWTR
jgi:hypothetical protein